MFPRLSSHTLPAKHLSYDHNHAQPASSSRVIQSYGDWCGCVKQKLLSIPNHHCQQQLDRKQGTSRHYEHFVTGLVPLRRMGSAPPTCSGTRYIPTSPASPPCPKLNLAQPSSSPRLKGTAFSLSLSLPLSRKRWAARASTCRAPHIQ